MSQRGTHYERAFEDWLGQRRLPYVAVDQAKKAMFTGSRIKSFDFIIYPPRGRTLLVDVKGRKLEVSSMRRGHLGQNWTTHEDIEGLGQWEEVFGPDYSAAFVFAFWLTDADPGGPEYETAYRYDHRAYVFVAAELAEYRRSARARSAKWQTVYVPAKEFERMARPLSQFLSGEIRGRRGDFDGHGRPSSGS